MAFDINNVQDAYKDYGNLRQLFYEELNEDRQDLLPLLQKIYNGDMVDPQEIKDFAERLLEYYSKLNGDTHPRLEQIIRELEELP